MVMDRIKKTLALFGKKNAPGMQTPSIVSLTTGYLDNLVNGLTPAKLRRILKDADSGEILDQHQLFQDIEDREEHIFTELAKRRNALLGLDWDILPPPALRNDAKAKKLAEDVKAQFDAIPGFENSLLSMADAIGHGFAPLEIEWDYVDGLHLPRALHAREQTWMQLAPDRHTLRLRDGSQEGVELNPFGWIVHRHKSKSGSFARHGLFRVLVWTYLLKQYARADFAEFLEIHGLPLRLGKYSPSATDDEKNILLKALRALGHDAAGIIPQDMEIEFMEAVKGSERPFATMIDHCERGQSKAILGGTLTTQADGRSSTNALGKVHNEVRHDLLVSDAVQVAASITGQMLFPLALLNAGCDDPRRVPWFQFDTGQPDDLTQLADAIPKLATVMQIPASWAHDKCRIPQAQNDEPCLEYRGGPSQSTGGTGQGAPFAEATAALAAQPAPAVPVPYDQAAVDAASAPLAALGPLAQDMLAPLLAELQNGTEPQKMLGRLAALYPALDTTELEELIARAIFVGNVWGRITADQN